jgi:translation initiation factor 2 gamma subunit (eIF-2gamma)
MGDSLAVQPYRGEVVMSVQNLRNIAIVAHVDHGKTTWSISS